MYAVIKDGIKMGNMNAVIITIARFFWCCGNVQNVVSRMQNFCLLACGLAFGVEIPS